MSGTEWRHPAEWEPHEATWLVWPQSADWPGKLAAVRWAYAEMIRALSPHEKVHILVDDAQVEARARRMLGPARAEMANLRFHHIPTDRGWTRDSLPAFVKAPDGSVRMAGFRFNGWARYATHTKDARIAEQLPGMTGLPLVKVMHQGRQVVLEGGGIDVNGSGTLLTTQECLLHPTRQVRNPGFTAADYEAIFREHLGASNVIWLPGGVAGDDTHGHVDDVCRFVNRTTVVLCREDDRSDPNHAVCAANKEVLKGTRLEDGGVMEIVDLPMPRPLFFGHIRLPASYANFLIANNVVLVPTFNDPNDRVALGILADLFPTRTVTGIHAVDLVLGLGSVHCLTHEQAA